MNYNRVIIAGHLARDPERRVTQGGTEVAQFALGVNRGDHVSFIDVVLYGKTAVTANTHLRKGSNVLVEGYLHQDRWTGSDGNKRSRLMVVGDTFRFVGKRGEPAQEEVQDDDDFAF